MLRQWTRKWRLRAAWLLALVYVLAVLAPTAANAFAVRAMEPVRHAMAATAGTHEHGANGHDHTAAHDHRHAASGSGHSHSDQNHGDHSHPGDKAGDLNCCGLACISALPAHDIDVTRPDRVLSVEIAFLSQESVGRAPPLLYRPPIS